VRAALAAVAFREGKLEPAVRNALKDKYAVRRAAAAEAICQPAGTKHLAEVKELLADKEPMVKVRVALALAAALENDSIPVLIEQLGDLPLEQGGHAEEFLRNLAGETAPEVVLEDSAKARADCRDAWRKWYKEKGSAIKLARSTGPRALGYTLLVNMDPNTGMGSVLELDRGNQKRWEIANLNYPMGVQVLPGNRVLIAEHNSNLVSERDFKGNILWQKNFNNSQPFSCQRLTNGNTFIATRNQLVEVDRTGKEIVTYNRPAFDIMAGHRFKNGHMAFVTFQGQYVRLDATGKELKSAQISQQQWYGAGIDFLPNDHVLYPLYNSNEVVEYDGDGKVVWKASVQWPTSAARLPNGNTLVASQQTQKVVEINRAGKVVSEYKGPYHPMRASRR
jgi:hypothetical protein